MLHIFHTVVSFTWHFLWCVCVCAQVKEDDYKLAGLSPSVQWLMMERLKSSPCESDADLQRLQPRNTSAKLRTEQNLT